MEPGPEPTTRSSDDAPLPRDDDDVNADPEGEDPALSKNRFTEGRLAPLCRAPWFLAVLCSYVLVQSVVVTGLTAATLTSIERRYGLSTTQLGYILSTYDFSVLCVVVFVGFYGGRRHVPRVLGSGLLLLSAGALTYASPHFFGGSYNVALPIDSDFCSGELLPECSAESVSNLVPLFFLGQVLIGLGAASLYSLGPPYLDRLVPKDRLPVYLSVFFAMTALGPALGFVIAGSLLRVWVDPGDRPDGVEPVDAEWVGAWWVGYVGASALGLLVGALFFLFPHYLPGTAGVRAENHRQTRALARRLARRRGASAAAAAAEADAAAKAVDDDAAADVSVPRRYAFGESLGALARNPAFLFNCFGQATESFSVTGFANFLPKAVESMFGLTASEASFTVGAILVPGAVGGTVVGGYLVRRLRLSAVNTARFTWAVALVALLTLFTFLAGCPTIELAGVTEPYAGGARPPPVSLASECNSQCLASCEPDRYVPVCGDDGLNYFSACHAGCDARAPGSSRVDLDARYVNCSCVGAAGGGGATRGKCDNGCSTLGAFLFGLFLAMFFTFLNTSPAAVCTLRTVPYEHRAAGQGVSNLVFRAAGTVPAPIVFGFFLERACVMFATDCGDERGNCWEYDSDTLRHTLLLLAIVPKALSFCFFFLSWWFFRPAAGFDEEAAAAGDAADDAGDADAPSRAGKGAAGGSSTVELL